MQNHKLFHGSMIALAVAGMCHAMDQNTADPAGTVAPTPTPSPVVIPEGMTGQIFHFRKEKVKDAEGNEVGEVKKHPSVTIPLPIPTKDEVLAIMTAPSEGEGNRAAEQKFILDLVMDSYYGQAREQINAARDANKDLVVSADIIDYSKLTILALATMPAGERGNKISDEDLKAFLEDYASVMPAASGKDANKIKAQVGLLEKGLRTVKSDKKVLGVMDGLLAMWAANTPSLEEHQAVYDMFAARLKKWQNAEPANVMASIL